MKSNIGFLLRGIMGLALAGTLAACSSEKEKEERRENAYDLSGGYKTTRSSGSKMDMNFEIRNETGRHDIVIHAERTSEFLPTERKLLTDEGLNADQIFSHFRTPITLGQGYNPDRLDGGENISKDFGETSEFYVCSEGYKYNAEYTVSYCLTGLAKKKDSTMKGELILTWSRVRKVTTGGQESTEVSSKQTTLSFHSNLGLVFYRQYLGSWTGEIFNASAAFPSNSFAVITISEIAGDQYQVRLGSQSSIELEGVTYTYDPLENQAPLSDLKESDYPSIQVVFTATDGARLLVIGQLWSLGNFTGSILRVSSTEHQELATFRFKHR